MAEDDKKDNKVEEAGPPAPETTEGAPYVPKRDLAHRTGPSAKVKPHIGESEYKEMYKQSVENPEAFWDHHAKGMIDWYRPYQTVKHGTFKEGDFTWFPEGELNASYNCVDRWAYKKPKTTAILWEADEPGNHREITYEELLREVCKAANVLTELGVRKGDAVAIYLPMVPEAAIAFLACARIGAVHSVVFAGFSAESLRDRINDCKAKVVITTDEGKRGGKTIATKSIVDAALKETGDIVKNVLVVRRTKAKINITEGRDLWWDEQLASARSYCPPVPMGSEDPLFILYTSGSTGKPKGVVHTTAGYLLGAAMTVKYVFDVHDGDKFACMADVGWITGHTYIVYGPLMNGVTTVIFESTPVYPDASRYWKAVEQHKLTQFYTAPTAIRLLRKLGEKFVKGHDLSSLRTIGSVGEPIAPDAWEWYHEHCGSKECAVVDTYWQTETGSIIITPIPGATQTKPGSATLPFFGIEPILLDPTSGKEIDVSQADKHQVEGVLAIKNPWPSMARTIYGDHKRFLETYLQPYPGFYFTGDGVGVDKDGYHWIKGRVDDVINVSGHRLSTAEIEAALLGHPGVAETAVVGVNDEMTGQAVYSFVILKPEFSYDKEDALIKELTLQVRKNIGPFAAPKKIVLLPDLPKTRSGKIMRRVLRKISAGEGDQLGDMSTLADPSIVDVIKESVKSK